jgi:lipopolysaccharide transport system permease protein
MKSLKLYWRQVRILTWANLKSRYRKTMAGFVWVVASPIVMYYIQSLVFKRFLKLDVPDYALFLLGGLLPWIFITGTLDMCTPIFTTRAELLKSFKISPFVLIVSQILDNFLNFLIAFLILLIPMTIYLKSYTPGLLFLPLVMVQLIVGVTGIASLFALAQVFMRDVRFILPFITNILFFLTPIFYPIEIVPAEYRIYIEHNPFYLLIDPFRQCIHQYNPQELLMSLLRGSGISLFFVILAYAAWKRKINEFYLHL